MTPDIGHPFATFEMTLMLCHECHILNALKIVNLEMSEEGSTRAFAKRGTLTIIGDVVPE